ncbi:hypothetical protein L208DRAFT_454934 [Tricholoma matsutake]|nr:hypothetical protein L208DRAFT_454934 [Tricholoma matsutake 945]
MAGCSIMCPMHSQQHCATQPFLTIVSLVSLALQFHVPILFGECFPAVFMDGHGGFEHFSACDFHGFGYWLVWHSDTCFSSVPGLTFMVSDAIQWQQYDADLSCLPQSFEGLDFQTQVWYTNHLLSDIAGADGSVAPMTGKLAGMVL